MKINSLEKKKVLILGIGREGADSFVFLRKKFPKKKLFVADKKKCEEMDLKTRKLLNDKNIELFLGDDYLKSIKGFDIILKSPGISLSSIKKYLSKKTKVTGQTELFFDNCPGMIIGVTGTKGKSTTSSLIYSVLKEAGFKAYLVGNIETPSLSFLLSAKKNDIFVYELSSHQLQNLEASPHIAVFLNIYPEHLDYYKNFKEYFLAKTNIVKYQKKNDYFIFNSKIKEIKDLSAKAKSKKIEINPIDFSKFLKDNQGFLEITHIDNLIAVLNVAKILKIKEEKIIKAFKKFKRPEHRLEFVCEKKGIRFYDDSIATIPEATIFALDSLGYDVETLIVGGFDRGIKFDKLADRIIKSNVKNLILLPGSGEKILKEIKKKKKKVRHFIFDNMKDVVNKCFQITSKNKICLLSPASPSFGIFRDYKERGDLFKKYIKDFK
ncbi:MAG TPA: UDP-N-acetylmuramoyl-L-alanine--D-glutamate ligase [Candidatus Pacearchaeota archaeon]|nr:UDP-N-acetylmuramoyl-L-alanine--D-glutamate ligase [Candidatus Pacearchaeota archaeon]HPR80172.1 UDP-N-acetylmuramoyl-L-alanine--D-glutamate ligase [Candidatus Pacearchaeota archaeon]